MPDQTTIPAETRARDAPASRGSALEIQQVYAKLPAQNVERARAFYGEKLDLHPYGEHNRHLHYELDGGYFIIFPSSGTPSGTHDQLGFIVDDIERTVAELQAKGVPFADHEPPPHGTRRNRITDIGGVRAAWFKDSEGNLISIAEFPGGSPLKRPTAWPRTAG
jgi:catechol 2,3-dioxygenase-like lactoylglutathione lyase family enzyme